MSHITTKLRNFANNIIRHEAVLNPPSPTQRGTVLPVTARMRPLLGVFMGQAGYRALIFRALVLARVEVPWLSEVEITADGGLTKHAKFSANRENEEEADGGEVLLAHLLGLLEAFIGELMTLRLLQELWPDLPKEANFTQGNTHE